MTQVDQAAFSCAACGKQFRWKPELAGKTVKCKCGSPLKVPVNPGDPSPAVASPVQPGLASAARSAEVPRRASSSGAHVPPPPPPPPGAAPKRSASVPAAKPARPAQQQPADDDGLDALAALAAQEAAVAEDAAADADSNFCANCRTRMSPEAVLCTNCGFDRRKGKVLGATKVKANDGRRLFGLLAPKKVDPKKPVDKMAPQGSFVVGVALSFGLAVAASVVWFLVCWGFSIDVYILIALVGAAAGVGMQLGQKGYSSLGGVTAAVITLVVMCMARMAVVVAILIPIMEKEGDDWDKPEPTRAELARRSAEYRDLHAGDRDNNAAIAPNEDPRVIAGIEKEVERELGIDPKFGNADTANRVHLEASIRASTMPAEKKQKYVEEYKREEERARLISMMVDEYLDHVREVNPDANVPWEATRDTYRQKYEKMTPEERKAELARLTTKNKAQQKKWEQEYKVTRAKEEREEALADGFDVPEEGAAPAASQPAGATAVAGASAADDDAMFDDEDAEDEIVGDEPAAAAVAAATPGAPAAAAAADGSSSAEEEEDDDSAIQFTLGMVLLMILFGGSIKGFIFIIMSLFLAYRTAAGSVTG